MQQSDNVIDLTARRALQLVAREVAEESFREHDADEQGFVDEVVRDYRAGLGATNDAEVAALWSLADYLEASLDWTDFQKRCAVAVLQREIGRRLR